ncbi:MAG: chorismate mutase [Clostridia bacterium]|nr:chorismate mutase [Clostridia bacterium]
MDLNELRNRIDEIDDEILELFEKRMELCREIGEVKAKDSLPLENLKREREIITSMREKADSDLADYVEELFEKIFHLSKEYQNEGR